MKHQHKLLATIGLMAALSLTGCWHDDDDETAPVTSTEVPDSAGVSTASFVSFILGLSGTDDTSEPLTLKELFDVPADETSEPTPLP